MPRMWREVSQKCTDGNGTSDSAKRQQECPRTETTTLTKDRLYTWKYVQLYRLNKPRESCARVRYGMHRGTRMRIRAVQWIESTPDQRRVRDDNSRDVVPFITGRMQLGAVHDGRACSRETMHRFTYASTPQNARVETFVFRNYFSACSYIAQTG